MAKVFTERLPGRLAFLKISLSLSKRGISGADPGLVLGCCKLFYCRSF